MSIEIVIGAVVVIAVVAYLVIKDSKDETPTEPTLVADKVEAEKAAPAPVVEAAPAPKKAQPAKKAATKKAAKVDLDSMNKTELLAHAKANGIKANASLKKEEILERIKNG